MKRVPAAQFSSHISYFGTILGVSFTTLGSFLENFGYIFRIRKQTEAVKLLQEAPTPKKRDPFGHILGIDFDISLIFVANKQQCLNVFVLVYNSKRKLDKCITVLFLETYPTTSCQKLSEHN